MQYIKAEIGTEIKESIERACSLYSQSCRIFFRESSHTFSYCALLVKNMWDYVNHILVRHPAPTQPFKIIS